MNKQPKLTSDEETSSNGRSKKDNRFSPPVDLSTGVAADHSLPHPDFAPFWEKIQLNDPHQKDRILSQALLTFTLRPKVDIASLPFHGLILLVGPPGTGKTSLAKGLANRTAEAFGGKAGFRYLEVEPHALANAGLGRSQQSVRKLLNEIIPERLQMGPLIVLLDEVETLAADRAKLSLEANPVDVHRATDAVLAGLDQLTATYCNLLFIATSNFSQAIDPALISRADLIEQIPLPGPETARAILIDAVKALASAYPKAANILDDDDFTQAARACQGLDGRHIRKLVISACTFDKQTALNPGLLRAVDILRAAEMAKQALNGSSSGGEG